MQTYFFYDIETTGLNKSFDQIQHFAAIRTDLNFRELKRYELKIKLNPDVIPSPSAMMTHHISIEEAQQGIPEYEAISQIHQWMNEPGTISLGYNTLGFDDEFMRFSFYRNLLPPYTHQYANYCGRMDIYPITVMFYLYKNEILKWPQNLKLENLNQLNQFVDGRSHHAMVDVEITLELAKKLSSEKSMWEFLQKFFQKNQEQTYFQKEFSQNKWGLLIGGNFGLKKNYQSPALFLGNHQYYKNQTVWLHLDTLEFEKISTPNQTRAVFKKWGEPEFILPPHARFLQFLSRERWDLSLSNQAWLLQNPDLYNQIVKYNCEFQYPQHPNVDIDASLYLDGFWNYSEENFSREFCKLLPNEKSKLIEKLRSSKLMQLGIRILGRNYPESLSSQQREIFQEYLKCVHSENETLSDYKGQKKLTIQAALLEINTLRASQTLNEKQKTLLSGLESYLFEKFPQ